MVPVHQVIPSGLSGEDARPFDKLRAGSTRSPLTPGSVSLHRGYNFYAPNGAEGMGRCHPNLSRVP